MKQRGNTLVICLLVLSLISLVSVSLYQLSLQQFKASHAHLKQTQQRQITQACIDKAITHWQQLTIHQSDKPLWQQPSSWWQQHGKQCQAQSWVYARLLFQHEHTQYVEIASFSPPNLIFIINIKVNQLTRNAQIINRAELNI